MWMSIFVFANVMNIVPSHVYIMQNVHRGYEFVLDHLRFLCRSDKAITTQCLVPVFPSEAVISAILPDSVFIFIYIYI